MMVAFFVFGVDMFYLYSVVVLTRFAIAPSALFLFCVPPSTVSMALVAWYQDVFDVD